MRFTDNDSPRNGALALVAAAAAVALVLAAELVLVPRSMAGSRQEAPSSEQPPVAQQPVATPTEGAADEGRQEADDEDPLDMLAGRELLGSLDGPSLSSLQADLAAWASESDWTLEDIELTYVGTSPDGDAQVTLVTDGTAVITGTETDGRWAFHAISITPEAYEGGDEDATAS